MLWVLLSSRCSSSCRRLSRQQLIRKFRPPRSPHCRRVVLCFSSHATNAQHHSSNNLRLWHRALQATELPRHLLLPKGHPDGSPDCALQALLGDVYIKTAVLKELGVTTTSKNSPHPQDSSSCAHANSTMAEGSITARVSETVSNKLFAENAVDILAIPGVNVTAQDLEGLPTHGRGTAVESAVAMVYDQRGEAPIRALARELLQRSQRLRNWKGYLLQMGGVVTCREQKMEGQEAGFVATATLQGHDATSSIWPNKLAAEQDAAEEVFRAFDLEIAAACPELASNLENTTIHDENWKGALLEMGGTVVSFLDGNNNGFCATSEWNGDSVTIGQTFPSKKEAEQAASRQILLQNGLDAPNERAAWKLQQAKRAMAFSARLSESEIAADWLQAGHDLELKSLVINQPSASGQKDEEWFLRNATKLQNAFSALLLAPRVLPDHVESAYVWGAPVGDDQQACLAVALVTLQKKEGAADHWFVSQTHPSMTQARSHVASHAIHELGLVDLAELQIESRGDDNH